MPYKPPTLCRFFLSLPQVTLTGLVGLNKYEEKVLDHFSYCKNIACRDKLYNTLLFSFARRNDMQKIEAWVVEQYEAFIEGLDLINNKSFDSIHNLVQNASAEEISILTRARLISSQIERHIIKCADCLKAYSTSVEVEMVNMSSEEKSQLNDQVARIIDMIADESSPEGKICVRVSGMTSDELSILLKGELFPEDALHFREHVKICKYCSERVREIEFLQSLESQLGE